MKHKLCCACCGCISDHIFTGEMQEFGLEKYYRYRCVDCDSDFYLKTVLSDLKYEFEGFVEKIPF